MAVPSTVHFRDLNQYLELHQVVSSPSSDTAIDVWGKVYSQGDTVDFVFHHGFGFDVFANDDWRSWYFIYSGRTYLFDSFQIVGRLVIVRGRLNTVSGGSYLSYIAHLTQSGTAAPVATVVENTLGATPVWARAALGEWTLTLADAFPANDTVCFSSFRSLGRAEASCAFRRLDDDTCFLETSDVDGTIIDAESLTVEVRVYQT